MKDIRVLIFGIPGTPIFEVGERLSTFHKLDFFTIEDNPDEEPSYFRDKIPSRLLDTGDFVSGSASSSMSRDISALEKDKELNDFYVPQIDTELEPDELEELSVENRGILSTEIPDIDLLDWPTHVLYFNADWDVAVEWFSKRRKCSTCGNVHHLDDKPPQTPGICDRCGSSLVIKEEDKPENVTLIYQEWQRAFSVFETKARKTKHWKSINVDQCKDFDDIVTKVDRWLRKTGLGEIGVNSPPRPQNKAWFPKRP